MSKPNVLIVGGSGNLGAVLAPALVAKDYNVIIGDVRPPLNLEDTPHIFKNLDCTCPQSIADFRREIENESVSLSHIVNVVGALKESGLTSMFQTSVDEIKQTVDINLNSQLYIVHGLGEHLMRAQGSNKSFVMISSINALSGYSVAFYTAAKGALHSFIRPAAIELGEGNVRINIVAMGSMKTSATMHQPKDFEARAAAAALQRLCSPQEVKDGIVACMELTAMTGQCLTIDGGQSVNPAESLYEQRKQEILELARN